MLENAANVELMWTTVVVELGEAAFSRAVEFWGGVTETTRSEPGGPSNAAVTLQPRSGHPFLQFQPSADGAAGIRLELSVASPTEAQAHATALGATTVAEADLVRLWSPGGLELRFLPHRGDRTVPEAVGAPCPNQVDQLCIDIPPALYDVECAFWAGLTGWELHDSALAEFRWFERRADLPLRFLLQRLDSSDVGQPTRAHLDIACGDHADEVSTAHLAIGATRIGKTKRWIQMRDPAGLDYCLTPREPPSVPSE